MFFPDRVKVYVFVEDIDFSILFSCNKLPVSFWILTQLIKLNKKSEIVVMIVKGIKKLRIQDSKKYPYKMNGVFQYAQIQAYLKCNHNSH